MARNSGSMPSQKIKKPPACDSCKFRRVLCHPQPDGAPCPRCIEKDFVCTTTPVTRGRPKRKDGSFADSPTGSMGHGSQLVQSGFQTPSPELAVSNGPPGMFQLAPELVRHLFESFVQLPQNRHPIFRRASLQSALSSVSWQIDLLQPQTRVLAYCVMALSSSISFHESVIGLGPRPKSFTDSSVFYRGADLREYGVRRSAVVRALHMQAFKFACDASIVLEASEDNAASCFILEVLDTRNELISRPWGGAYLSHVRTLAASWEEPVSEGPRQPLLASFLMGEALSATVLRRPVLVTENDQLLIIGDGFPPLQQMLNPDHLAPGGNKKILARRRVFSLMCPFMFHVTRVARELHEKVTGDYARRRPPAENAIIDILSSLTAMQTIRSDALAQLELEDWSNVDPAVLPFFSLPAKGYAYHSPEVNLRACAYGMTCGWSTIVLALHQEMERPTDADAPAPESPWVAERLALLRRQVHALTQQALAEVIQGLRRLPSLPHISHLGMSHIWIVGWVQFSINEAEAAGEITPEHVEIFETLTASLKMIGYSWDIPAASAYIERMQSYIAMQRASESQPATSLVPMDDSVFSDMFLTPLDPSWMGVFSV
ncbi:hypothetical protein C8J57DRAFT_70943 [Mycena rebaudengoi]|nr:hypothetical protein C8J57DRAFT_70943 [Mycena rebaudengoi]